MKNDYIGNKPWALAPEQKNPLKRFRLTKRLGMMLVLLVLVIIGALFLFNQKKHHAGVFKPTVNAVVKPIKIPLAIPALTKQAGANKATQTD